MHNDTAHIDKDSEGLKTSERNKSNNKKLYLKYLSNSCPAPIGVPF